MVVEQVRAKTEQLGVVLAQGHVARGIVPQTAQNLYVLSMLVSDGPLRVLELGGACGATYLEMRHILGAEIGQWSVVETHLMAEAGRSVHSDARITFHTAIESAAAHLRQVDVVIAQGALQYMPNPSATLDALFDVGSRAVYLTRTEVALGDGPEFMITRQTVEAGMHGPRMPCSIAGPLTHQPVTYWRRDALESFAGTRGACRHAFEESPPRSLEVGSRTLTIQQLGWLWYPLARSALADD